MSRRAPQRAAASRGGGSRVRKARASTVRETTWPTSLDRLLSSGDAPWTGLPGAENARECARRRPAFFPEKCAKRTRVRGGRQTAPAPGTGHWCWYLPGSWSTEAPKAGDPGPSLSETPENRAGVAPPCPSSHHVPELLQPPSPDPRPCLGAAPDSGDRGHRGQPAVGPMELWETPAQPS